MLPIAEQFPPLNTILTMLGVDVALLPQPNEDIEDEMLWEHTPNGELTVASTHEAYFSAAAISNYSPTLEVVEACKNHSPVAKELWAAASISYRAEISFGMLFTHQTLQMEFVLSKQAYEGYLLGLDLIPGFNNPSTTGSDMLRGVNFASSSAGILNDTAKTIGQRIPLSQQVENFGEKVLPEIRYLLPIENPLNKPIPPNFDNFLIKEYRIYLKKLYDYGARKFLVTGLAPLGCVPIVIGFYSKDTNQCFDKYNEISVQFSAKIKAMVKQLNQDLPGAYILYWDIYTIMKQVVDNPTPYVSGGITKSKDDISIRSGVMWWRSPRTCVLFRYGALPIEGSPEEGVQSPDLRFKHSHTACCGAGRANGLLLCLPVTFLCHDRSEFVFWDAFHPSDAANAICARQAYEGVIQSTYPNNVKQLMQC
ncbi:hypothetical protein IFM89_026073 [Coptis chinensis]|uniref:GDSL esterase/lipase n=1 Tax=Coptis chinensis TaxID=261450 RepID=A0A835ID95_9MAGN|nr:hypothetical protein IFM89_026073 [Coptis chinensis]